MKPAIGVVSLLGCQLLLCMPASGASTGTRFPIATSGTRPADHDGTGKTNIAGGLTHEPPSYYLCAGQPWSDTREGRAGPGASSRAGATP